MPQPLPVLFEDNHLLVVNKPCGLATMGVEEGLPSAWSQAAQYLKDKYHKPGNVYLGVVSRLDLTVSGVLLFARTSKAAARLNEQFRDREVQKTYWAILERAPPQPQGTLGDWLQKNDSHRRIRIAASQSPQAQWAELSFRYLRAVAGGALVEVDLHTGRKHQIRVQFAAQGCPVVGDRKYGARSRPLPGIALHAQRLQLTHPVRKTPLDISAPPPAWWTDLGVS